MSSIRYPLVDIEKKDEWASQENFKSQLLKEFEDKKRRPDLLLLPDGQVVSYTRAGYGASKAISIWDFKTTRCQIIKEYSGNNFNSLHSLGDGRILYSKVNGSKIKSDTTIYILEPKSRKFEQLVKLDDELTYFILLPNERIACCVPPSYTEDYTIKIWNLKNGNCEKILKGHESFVEALILLPDGRIASGSWDGTIRVWNVDSGKCEQILTGDLGLINKLILLPEGRVASSSSNVITVFNLKNGNCERTFKLPCGDVFSMISLPNGQIAVTNVNVYLCDVKSGQMKLAFKAKASKESQFPNSFHSLLLLPDGLLACSTEDGSIILCDIGLRRQVAPFNADYASSTQLITRQLNQAPMLIPLQQASAASSYPHQDNSESSLKISYEISYSDLHFGKELGKGGFGVVYQGTWKRVNAVAIKQLLNNSPSQDAADEFKNEAQIMAQLRCDYTVKFIGYCLKPSYSLVMEYLPRGSLYKVLHSGKDLSWEVRYKIIRDIASGLFFLHENNIVHRDLKSLNILLDEYYNAKLCDFGLSKVKTETLSNSTKSPAGTLAWMAPEVLEGKGCSKESDIYSLGITFWEIASMKRPFENAGGNSQLLYNWIIQGKHDDMPKDCPKKLSILIEQCWAKKSSKRPTAAEVLNALPSEPELANGVNQPAAKSSCKLQ